MRLEYSTQDGGFMYNGNRVKLPSASFWKGGLNAHAIITDDFSELCDIVKDKGYNPAKIPAEIPDEDIVNLEKPGLEGKIFSIPREFRGVSEPGCFYVFNETEKKN